MANSTRLPVPGIVSTFVAYCWAVSTSESSAASWTSPHIPRDLTLASTRFRSPTPVASVCISPRPRCTCSRRSETIRNESPRRCSRVAESFSSTVARICSSLAALSLRKRSSRCSTVARTPSSRCSLVSVRLAICSPNRPRAEPISVRKPVAAWPCSVRVLARSWRMSRSACAICVVTDSRRVRSSAASRIASSRVRAIAATRHRSAAANTTTTMIAAKIAGSQNSVMSKSRSRKG